MEGSADTTDDLTFKITDDDGDSATVTKSISSTDFSVDIDLGKLTFDGGNNDGLSEGTTDIAVEQADSFSSAEQTTTFVVDDTSPTVSINSPTGASPVDVEPGNSFTVDYDVSDKNDVSDVTVRLHNDGNNLDTKSGLQAGDNDASLTVPRGVSIGTNLEVTVEATDSAANSASTTETDSVSVTDKIPEVDATVSDTPVTDSTAGDERDVDVSFSEPMDTTAATTVEITGISQSPLTVAGSWQDDKQWSGTVTVTDNDEDTSATVSVTATDDEDNENTDKTNTFTVDTLEPSVSQSSFPSDPISGTVDVTSYFTVTDDDGGTTSYEYSDDGGDTWSSISSPGSFDTTNANDGTVNLKATDTDDAGNSDSASGKVTVDNSKPSNGGIAEPVDDVYKRPYDNLKVGYYYEDDNPQNLKVELVDGDGNTDNTVTDITDSQYVDDGAVRTITLESLLDGVTDDQYNVKVVATDSAGNENSFETSGTPVYVDSTDKPSVTVNSLNPSGTAAPGDTVTVDYDYSEDSPTTNADITFELDGTDLGTQSDVAPGTGLTHDVTLPNDIEGDYQIKVTADKHEYDDSASDSSSTLTVNGDVPTIQSVEAEVDSDQVEVRFDEPVYANDGFGSLDATDFGYEDVSGDDAASINDATHSAGDSTVTLTLDKPVSESDLNTDLIGARQDEVYDEAGDTAGTAGVELQDTETNFNFESPAIDAQQIGVGNQKDYSVDVYLNAEEPVDVSLALNGPGADQISPAQKTDVTDDVTFDGLDVSDFDDGTDNIDIDATVDDKSKTEDHSTTTTEAVSKHTAPAFSHTENADADDDTFDVYFTTGVQDSQGNALSADDLDYLNNGGSTNQAITNVDHSAGDTDATITLNNPLTEDDLGVDEIVTESDSVFNTDGTTSADDSLTISDTTAPSAVEIASPVQGEELLRSQSDTLQVTYNYDDTNPQDVEVTLEHNTYQASASTTLDDSQYSDNGVDKTVTLDIDDEFATATNLPGVYDLKITVTDENGNEHEVTNAQAVTIDDGTPDVSVDDVTVGQTASPQDVATDETVQVDFTYTDVADGTATMYVDHGTESESTKVKTVDVSGTEVFKGDSHTEEIGLSQVTGIDNSEIEIDVAVEDSLGNANGANSKSLNVNDEAPAIDSVEAHANTDTVDVSFTEWVTAADGDFSADEFYYEDISEDSASAVESVEDDVSGEPVEQVTLSLDDAVDASDVDADEIGLREDVVFDTGANGGVAAGTESVALTESPPELIGIDATVDDPTVRVGFDEGVYTNSDGTSPLTATDFGYTNNAGGANDIDKVEHNAGDRFATVYLNNDVSSEDLGSDTLDIPADSIYDSAGLSVNEQSVALGDRLGPDAEITAESNGQTVDVTLTANEELDSTTVHVSGDRLLTDIDDETYDNAPSYTLDESDFELDSSDGEYVYVASTDVDRDGSYYVSGVDISDTDGNSQIGHASDGTDVDDTDPTLENAVLLDVGTDTTTVGVRTDEPISFVSDNAVSVEGATVTEVDSSQSWVGYLEITVDERLQTGDSPDVSVTGGQERAGDTSIDDSTTVHTLQLDLEEGKNFVSVPAVSGALDLGEVDTQNVDTIWTYDGSNWQSFDPDASENDISSLHGGQGYIFVMDSADTIDANVYNEPASSSDQIGNGVLLNEQQLQEGWNLVGHYRVQDEPAHTALGSIIGNVHAVYEQSGQTGLDYTVVNTNENLQTGDGYWVFVTEDETYTFSSDWGDR